MTSTFEQARAANQQATAALAARNRAKERAATTPPGRDVHDETAARVKRAGNGPWVPQHGDSTHATNTGK